jgi:hypothetical protein
MGMKSYLDDFIYFLRKKFAFYLFIGTGLWLVVSIILSAYEYKVVSGKPVLEVRPLAQGQDKDIQAAKDILADILRKREIPDQEKKGSQFPERPKMIRCWQCDKEIPADKAVCPFCRAVQRHTDYDHDGMPDYWEIRYGLDPDDPADADLDADKDGYANLQEYQDGTDPADPEDNPATRNFPYIVEKIYKKPVEILFMGYVEEKNGSFTLQINWEKGGQTFLVKVGDTIRGYSIESFRKIVRDIKKKGGAVVPEDTSFIVLKKREETLIKLVRNVMLIEREYYATLRLKEASSSSPLEVRSGTKFVFEADEKKEEFEVTDITIDQVFYKDPTGRIRFISLRKND